MPLFPAAGLCTVGHSTRRCEHGADAAADVGVQVCDAAMLMLRTWSLERRHEQDSPYAYAELPRGGRGSKTNYTGQSLRDWANTFQQGTHAQRTPTWC